MTTSRCVDVEGCHRVDHANGRRAEIERALARFLNRAAVHDRVAERNTDFDRIGTGIDDRAHDLAPLATETAGDVGNEQLATGLALLAQVPFEVHSSPSVPRLGLRLCRRGPRA